MVTGEQITWRKSSTGIVLFQKKVSGRQAKHIVTQALVSGSTISRPRYSVLDMFACRHMSKAL